MSRKRDFERLVGLIGGAARIENSGDGWPGVAVLDVQGQERRVAIHVGPVGKSHRDRDDKERRFQNPGGSRPLREVPGAEVLLLGLWEADTIVDVKRPVVVAMETTEHRFAGATRQSYFVPLHSLRLAGETGWAEHVSEANERIVVMWPELLPAFVAMSAEYAFADPETMVRAIGAAGVGESDDEEEEQRAADRAVRQAWVVVRDSKFAKRVKEAYDGACGLCGLDYGLVDAAHIYPASAPGAEDIVPNGICLCPNHHRAFDRHLIWVEPRTLDVRVHPHLDVPGPSYRGRRTLADVTDGRVMAPDADALRPDPKMFRLRYEHFPGVYDWAS